MDHHVDGPITRGLRKLGIDVVTADEDDHEQHSDADILQRSTELGRVLVTYDEDFYAETSRCWASGEDFSGVMIIPSGTFSWGEAIRTLYLFAMTHDRIEFLNRREVINGPLD